MQLASVIGRQFLVRLLDRIADGRGKLDGVLGELKALEIIYEQGLLPEPAYIFKQRGTNPVDIGRGHRRYHYNDRDFDHFEEILGLSVIPPCGGRRLAPAHLPVDGGSVPA